MKTILKLIVLTTYLTSTSLGAPQIFPFTSLRSYFDHQARHGPGGEKKTVDPELSTVVDTPLFRHPSKIGDSPVKAVPEQSPTKFPKSQQPTNSNPDILPSVEPPSASAAASPVLKYLPAIPEQVLKAPDAVPPLLYGPVTEQDKTNSNYQIPQVTADILSHVPISVVGEKKYKLLSGYAPLLPSQVLLSPPTAYQQKNTDSYLTTIPSQDLQNPTVPFKFPEGYVNQNTQDNPQITISPAKVTKTQNLLYPKKWRPEKEKDEIKKKLPQNYVTNLTKLNKVKVSSLPKTDAKERKTVPTSLEAASSLQKTDFSLFPVTGKQKFPGLDEQITSETGFSGITAGVGGYGIGGDGGGGGGGGGGGSDRVEFQMHGQQGPHSYKFGYDTGKGHNRQFRYEERDNHGHVKGHYGFYNKHGKLQIVNYSADPEHGFHADGNYGKHGIV